MAASICSPKRGLPLQRISYKSNRNKGTKTKKEKKKDKKKNNFIRLSAAYSFFFLIINGTNKCFCIHTNCWFWNRTLRRYLCRSIRERCLGVLWLPMLPTVSYRTHWETVWTCLCSCSHGVRGLCTSCYCGVGSALAAGHMAGSPSCPSASA